MTDMGEAKDPFGGSSRMLGERRGGMGGVDEPRRVAR